MRIASTWGDGTSLRTAVRSGLRCTLASSGGSVTSTRLWTIGLAVTIMLLSAGCGEDRTAPELLAEAW